MGGLSRGSDFCYSDVKANAATSEKLIEISSGEGNKTEYIYFEGKAEFKVRFC